MAGGIIVNLCLPVGCACVYLIWFVVVVFQHYRRLSAELLSDITGTYCKLDVVSPQLLCLVSEDARDARDQITCNHILIDVSSIFNTLCLCKAVFRTRTWLWRTLPRERPSLSRICSCSTTTEPSLTAAASSMPPSPSTTRWRDTPAGTRSRRSSSLRSS